MNSYWCLVYNLREFDCQLDKAMFRVKSTNNIVFTKYRVSSDHNILLLPNIFLEYTHIESMMVHR